MIGSETTLVSKKSTSNHLMKLSDIKEEDAWSDWRFSSTIWNFPVGKLGREGVHGLEDHEKKFYHTFRNPNRLYVSTAFAGKLVPHLVRKLIHKYSEAGDLILDSFTGSGTIPVEAKLNQRNCIALDINPKCVSLAKRKIEALASSLLPASNDSSITIQEGDARNLSFLQADTVDLVLTHPPYWGLIDFSEIENDLCNLSLGDYLKTMTHVLKEFYRVLKKDKFCIIVIGDARKRGVVPLGAYLTILGLHIGFNLWDLLIYDTRFGGKQVEKYRKIRSQQKKFHLTDHDYVLVFQKRDKGWSFIEIADIIEDGTSDKLSTSINDNRK